MEPTEFDAVTSELATGTTRRRTIATLGTLVLAGVGVLPRAHSVEAQGKRKKHKKGHGNNDDTPPTDPVTDPAEAQAKQAAHAERRRRKHKPKPPTTLPPTPPPTIPPPRFPNQTPCSSSGQCESGTCAFNGRGQVCCVQNGGRCTADFDCCGNGLCDFGTGTCF